MLHYSALLTFAVLCLQIQHNEAVECEHEWTLYKDEVCIRLLNDHYQYPVNWDAGKADCNSLSTENSAASLLQISSVAFQNFIASNLYNGNLYDDIWIGARMNAETGIFEWEDGTPLAYENWAVGYPINQTESTDRCAKMGPPNTLFSSPAKWKDAPCGQRNLVVCQQNPRWSFGDLVSEVLKLRNQVASLLNN